MSRPIEVFNIFQKKTKTRVHLKVDEAMEGLYREVRAGRQKTFLDHLSGLLHLKCSKASTDPRVRIQSSTERKEGVNAIMTK